MKSVSPVAAMTVPIMFAMAGISRGHADDAIPPAEIGGPMTKEMAGLHLGYTYSTGRQYQLDFAEDTVTFLAHKDPSAAPGTVFKPGTMHYLARKLRPHLHLYLVHWLNRSKDMGNIHVALVIDLDQKTVYVSALMPRGVEFFDTAEIQSVSWAHKQPGD
jgi:hypothetical protein